ncbi:MAG: SRPBCC domain-containing protein [Acidobacteriia bacterium]|nr:SRPBCC domain-containing protein [Terriglobia bacterium]
MRRPQRSPADSSPKRAAGIPGHLPWAFPADKGNAAKTSRVTFTVEPWMNVVRLTVTHDELEPDSPMLHGVSSGWPSILSSLKTLLESGLPLPGTEKRMTEPPK